MLKKSLISLFMGLTTSYAGTMGPVCVASKFICQRGIWFHHMALAISSKKVFLKIKFFL
jgi:hypothetical protein